MKKMTRGTAVGASLALLAVIGGLAFVITAAQSTDVTPPPGWVVDKAKAVAEAYGDPHPSSIQWAQLPASEAAPLLGLTPGEAGAEYSRQVVVLVMQGTFEKKKARVPADAAKKGNPKGQWVVVSFDAVTHTGTDSYIGTIPVATTGLGFQEMTKF
jgi:hypothetical protein